MQPNRPGSVPRRSAGRVSSGFTLVEILIVIAIVGILTAILLPVLSRARESGRSRVCASRMQQLGLAFRLYVDDANHRYPGAGQFQKWGGPNNAAINGGWSSGHWVAGTNGVSNSPSGAPGGLALLDSPYTWTNKTATVEKGALYPYAKSPELYYCPSNADGSSKHLSYSMNCALGGMSNVRIRDTDLIVLLVDEKYCVDGYFWAVDPPAGQKTTDALTDIHNSGGNLLFVDGHVKFYPFAELPLDDSAAGRANKSNTPGTATFKAGQPRFYDPAFGADNPPAPGGPGPKPYFFSADFASCGKPDGP